MTGSHLLRLLTFAFGVIAVGGGIDALVQGRRRGMTVSQASRFVSWILLLLLVMSAQYRHYAFSATWVTWASFAATLIGALGVWSELRRPLSRKAASAHARRSSNDPP